MHRFTLDILRLIADELKHDKTALISLMNTNHDTRNALIGMVWSRCHNKRNTANIVSDFIGHVQYNYSMADISMRVGTPVRTMQCTLKEFCPLSPMPPRLFVTDMAVHIIGTLAFMITTDGVPQLCVRVSRELGQFLKTLAAIFNNPNNRDAITSNIIGSPVTSGGYSQRVLKNLGIVAFTTQNTSGDHIAYIDTLPGYTPVGNTVNLIARINVQYKFIRLIAG